MSNITSLRAVQVKAAPKASRAQQRKIKRQAMAASWVGLVALTLTALSLTHLADGISMVTHASCIQAWSMAVGIDLGFIALEVAQMSASTPTVQKQINRWAKPAVIITIAVSAIMNAFAFGGQATGSFVYAAWGLGVAIPALIYVLTRVGVDMWLATK